MVRYLIVKNWKSWVELQDKLELVDCNSLREIVIGSDNISKEDANANIDITDLQNLEILKIGSNSCRNAFLFQLSRFLLFRIFDDRFNDVEIFFCGRVRVLQL